MTTLRHISTGIWTSGTFRGFPGHVQILWLYLLTNRHTTEAPGIFVATPQQLADDLQWDPAEVSAGLQYLIDGGHIMVDSKVNACWIPNATRFRPLDDPAIDEAMASLPHCKLVKLAARALAHQRAQQKADSEYKNDPTLLKLLKKEVTINNNIFPSPPREDCPVQSGPGTTGSVVASIPASDPSPVHSGSPADSDEFRSKIDRVRSASGGHISLHHDPLYHTREFDGTDRVALQELAQHWEERTGQQWGATGDTKTRIIKFVNDPTRGGFDRARQAIDGWMERCRAERTHPGRDMWCTTHTSLAWVFPAAYVDNKLDRTEPDYDQIQASAIFAPEVAAKHKHYKLAPTNWHPSLEPAPTYKELSPDERKRGKAAMEAARAAFGASKPTEPPDGL